MMKELTYKGATIEYHRVKGKKAPKIEQLAETMAPSKSAEQQSKEDELLEMLNQKRSKLVAPDFRLYSDLDCKEEYDFECSQPSFLILEF